MKTVIDTTTGKKLYDTVYYDAVLAPNEKLVDFMPDVMSSEMIQLNEQNHEFEMYLKRKTDGENAYLKLSAEFRLAKLAGQISEEEHSIIEETLTPVRNEIMFGQWKKGYEILTEIGSAIIGQSLYDRLSTQLNDYIHENY